MDAKRRKLPKVESLFMEQISIVIDGQIRQVATASAIIMKLQSLALRGNRRAQRIYRGVQKYTGVIAMTKNEAPDPELHAIAYAMLEEELAKLIAAEEAAIASEKEL